jgi:hypothetical protein
MSFSKAVKLPYEDKPSRNWFKIPRIPYSDARSVDQYFALPKSEREWHGLYKLPFSLPLEWFGGEAGEKGWEAFHKQIKSEYPIQHFFRNWLPSMDNPLVFAYKKFIGWPLRESKCATKLFLNPQFPRWRKVAPRHKYTDTAELIVQSNFALIVDFYREEVVDGHVDWSADDLHKKFYTELIAAVHWIEEERKKVEKLIDESLSKSVKNKVMKDGKFDFFATYADHDRLEEHKKQKDTEILVWFVNNREFFWT